MALDYESIGNILEAVRLAGVETPHELRLSLPYRTSFAQSDAFAAVRRARSEFSRKIEWAYTLENIQPTLTSNNKAKNYSKKLEEIASLAKRLSHKIDGEDNQIVTDLMRHVPNSDKRLFHEILYSIDEIAIAANSEIKRRESIGTFDQSLLNNGEQGLNSTPGATFIGALADCFTKIFAVEATVYRPSIKKPGASDCTSSEEIKAPFVAFVKAVTVEHGDPMTRGAISKRFERWQGSR